MMRDLEKKSMPKESPILVRTFKEESELEVWKQDTTGHFALLKTYPICRWSGELGPKIKEGDRQAPEGFYTITPAQLNPNSHYYLSFDIGYPNAFDRAHGRTGSNLMVHGDCSSRGCYAMTDEQIAEIYALARESFFGGQKSFQIQAYPFRMTPVNMAKHRNSVQMASASSGPSGLAGLFSNWFGAKPENQKPDARAQQQPADTTAAKTKPASAAKPAH